MEAIVKKFFSYLMIFCIALISIGISLSIPSYSSSDISGIPLCSENYVEDELLVTFKNTASQKKLKTISSCAENELICAEDSNSTYIIKLSENDSSLEAAMEKFKDDPNVINVQPNYLYTLDDDVTEGTAAVSSASPSNSDTDLWNLKKIDTQQAWDLIDSITAKDNSPREPVTVAILDTGIDVDHEDLKDALLDPEKCVDVVGISDPSQYIKLTADDGGHGTRVAGVLAATSNNGIGVAGVAAGNNNNLVKIVGIDVYEYFYSQNSRLARTSDIIKGIEYACSDAVNAKVINMSLGLSSSQTDELLHQAIKSAREKNITIVASGGNTRSTTPWYCSDYDEVLGIIATTDYHSAFDICKASFSGYGSHKTLSAPGQKISTTSNNGKYTYTASGTSYAAPLVSGVAAMLYYVNPAITADEVEAVLTSTSTDLYTKGFDIYTGYGNVNAYAAVAKAADVAINSFPGHLPTPLVSAKSAGYNRICLKWEQNNQADGYYIYRSTSNKGTFSRVKTIHSKDATVYINSGLKTNCRYYYKVIAFGTLKNKKAYSRHSSIVSVRPVPSSPSNIKLSSYNYKAIGLKWNKVSGASGYGIYRSTTKNGKFRYIYRIKRGTVTSYTDSNRKPGHTYYYKIRTYRIVNGKRIYGPFSGVYKQKSTPAKVTITSIKKKGSNRAAIKWKATEKTNGYCIYRSYSVNGTYTKIKTVQASKTPLIITGKLKKNKTYYYKIRAYSIYKGKRIYGPYSSIKKFKYK